MSAPASTETGALPKAASGLIELRSDGALARIDADDGGRIVSLVIGGTERLVQKADARAKDPPLYWGCYPMVPWAGRLAGGRIPTAQGEVRLEENLPPSAIHGLGFDKPWEVIEASEVRAVLSCELRGLRWPFGGRARQIVALTATTLELDLEVGGYARPGPAGLGWHPWFARPHTGDIELRVDGSEVLVLDSDQIPTGEVRPVSAKEDLRSGPVLGDRRLDHVYVRTSGPASLGWPDLNLEIEYGRDLATVVVYTPADGICVEPQTMWPNAPLLKARGIPDTGLRTLEPGGSLFAKQRWRWSPRKVGG